MALPHSIMPCIDVWARELTYLNENSTVNQITTKISIFNKYSVACFSYSSIVENTLKAKHVNTIKNLQ